ncbi:MAG: BioY family protein [Methanocella sp. PtaU1.Bin125]|nr:MAG: BioY family protein [Methanocella sp. PtaU1.Bin125]
MESSRQSSYVRKMVYASLFAALTAAAAWISIPIPLSPLPVTLQTLFTMLSGAVLGPYFGVLAMIVYVLLGLIGLPVFAAGQSGPGVLFGPWGGYLIGFVFGAAVTGLIAGAKEKPGLAWLCMAMAVGDIVVYVFGVAQLALILQITLDKAILIGFFPFVPGDILKLAIATVIAGKMKV